MQVTKSKLISAKKAALKIVEVRSELGAGQRGASLGVDAIKIASVKANSKFFGTNLRVVVKDENSRMFQQVQTPFAKRSVGIYKVLTRISKAVAKVLIAENRFPIVLSGDHSNAAGTIAGIRLAYPNKRLGVMWIDAHADLHSPYTSPSGNMHGMPLAISIADDNLECQKNDVKKVAIKYWEKAKNLAGIKQKVKPTDIVFFAVRDTEAEENHLIAKHKIRNFNVNEIRQNGAKKIANEALKLLKDCDLIYVSFDVDSLDTSISVGTGTPVNNGLMVSEAQDLLQELVKDPRTCCFEIVEVNPLLDLKGNSMGETAFGILEKTANVIKKVHTLQTQK